MRSGDPWKLRGIRRDAQETAREAARRAGMSVGEWLDSVISAEENPPETRHATRDYPDYEAASERDEEPRDYNSYRAHPPAPRSAPPSGDDPAAIDRSVRQLNARLDDLSRQLTRAAQLSEANASRASVRDQEAPPQLVEVISKLDRRLDQLMTEGRASKSAMEQRVDAVSRAVADLNPKRTSPPQEPATPLDQAMLEIANRQRTLDGKAAPEPPRTTPTPESLPRPRTQELSGLEQQLRTINSQIASLKQPCGIDKAIDTLRDDLAEIGVMLQDALPRKSVEALEGQVRKLAERIEETRNAGADGSALVGLERGLAEVRDALRSLSPAEGLVGIDRELQQLSHKLDVVAHNSQDPTALRQLEGAIVAMRGIVSQVASNDALASLSQEVRALAGKVDRATDTDSSNILSALEQRIAALADALERRNQGGQKVPNELEAAISGLVDKIERVQLTPNNHAALGHLEDRIAKLVEKLDASDNRLNHLEAIERGLAELLIHLEHQRLPNVARGAAEVDDLSRNVSQLRQTEQKTREALETVHGTLGHVVDRLAMIETDIRNTPARRVEEWLTEAFSRSGSSKPKEPELHAAAAGGNGKDRKSQPPTKSEASAALPSSPAPLPQALEPIDLEAPLTPELPAATAAERRPFDPDLPPDHPLEPGSSGTSGRIARSPAERIAASESVLAGAKPPPATEVGGKSSFIAAARRAAQAAGRESPSRSAVGGPREIASAAGKLAKRVGKLRALIGATAGVLIVLGAFQVARIWLGSPEQPEQSPPVQQVPGSSERSPDSTVIKPAAAPDAVPPTISRQSSAYPANGGTDSTILAPEVAPEINSSEGQPTRTMAPSAERDVTGSILPLEKSAKPPTANTPTAVEASTPAPAAKPPAAPTTQPSAPHQAAADKLPPAFGSTLRNGANKADASAQYEIAVRFAEGRGVPQNLGEAAEWFERAAKQGLAPAQFRLAGLYEKGLGVKKNIETARRFYVAAGEAGNAKALHNLAVLYAEGVDGKPDYQTAARWFRKAADYGVADSQYNLAILYARGIGVEQNFTEAYKWFALAALQGDVESAKKRDELGARLDAQSLNVAMQAVQTWMPEHQPEAAVEVKPPPGGWDAAASSAQGGKRKPVIVGPKLDLATPVRAQ